MRYCCFIGVVVTDIQPRFRALERGVGTTRLDPCQKYTKRYLPGLFIHMYCVIIRGKPR